MYSQEEISLFIQETIQMNKKAVITSNQLTEFAHFLEAGLEEFYQTIETGSVKGKGNCYDNPACESLFSHLKSESLRLYPPEDMETLIRQIRNYIDWYNYHGPQEKLKGMTPLEFREAYLLKT